jgi:hypothetical protein
MHKTSILAAAALAVALTAGSSAQARPMGGGWSHSASFSHMGGMHSSGFSHHGSWGGGMRMDTVMHSGFHGGFGRSHFSHRGFFVGSRGFHRHHRFFGRGFGAGIAVAAPIVTYGYSDYASFYGDEDYPEVIGVSPYGAAAYSAASSVPGVAYTYGRGGCCCD